MLIEGVKINVALFQQIFISLWYWFWWNILGRTDLGFVDMCLSRFYQQVSGLSCITKFWKTYILDTYNVTSSIIPTTDQNYNDNNTENKKIKKKNVKKRVPSEKVSVVYGRSVLEKIKSKMKTVRVNEIHDFHEIWSILLSSFRWSKEQPS